MLGDPTVTGLFSWRRPGSGSPAKANDFTPSSVIIKVLSEHWTHHGRAFCEQFAFRVGAEAAFTICVVESFAKQRDVTTRHLFQE